MTPPMKPALFLLAAICLLLPASACPAEILIRGNITDRQGKPVEAVIVKLFQGNALVAYTSSKADGSYQLGGTPETPQVRLTFEHLSYQTQALTLENRSQTQDVVLKEKSLTLKEVTVTAPVIAQQGDTLSFRLSAFTGAGDISLRDALRKIPGIHVAQNGKIRYLGKDISRFYIEGLDLLGGQYNIATNNLPASYISTVQVLNHHQPVKLEKKVFSDQVALNVKLNPKAKFRPIGNYEASAGYGDEMLYQLSAAGMLFNPDFQSILTAKIGNVREFEQEENAHLITDESDGHDAPDLLGRLSSSTPPLDRKRYIHPDDRSLTLNILNRIGQDATLKAQIGYGYTRTRYDFQTLRSYYNGTSDLVLEEAQAPLAHTHTPELTLKYELNADQRYVTNILSTSASLCEDQLPTRRNLSEIRQTEEMQRYALSNAFQLRWKRGAVRWNFSSLLKYDAHPTGRLSLSTESEADNDLIQTTRNYRFFTREALSLAYDFHRSSLYFPWTFQATSDRIHTHLSLPGTSERNDLSGENYELSFAPRYEYTHPRQKYVFRAELALKGEHHRFQNTGNAPARDKGFRFSLNPYLYFNYKLNAKSTLRARLSYNRGNIDILDLLTAPIQTDYLTRSYQSGLLADVKTWTTSLHYDFKLPLEMWFFNLDATHTRTWNNLLDGQQIAAEQITQTRYLIPHHTDRFTSSGEVSKYFPSLQTKISLQASYTWSQNAVLQQAQTVHYYGQILGCSIHLNTRPWPFLELDYNASLSKNFSRYLAQRQSIRSQTHQGKLSLFPVSALELAFSADLTRKEIAPGQCKTFPLLDTGLHYTFRKLRICIDLNNILHRKEYAYTIFDGLNRFSYQYRLRGREVLVSFRIIQ